MFSAAQQPRRIGFVFVAVTAARCLSWASAGTAASSRARQPDVNQRTSTITPVVRSFKVDGDEGGRGGG